MLSDKITPHIDVCRTSGGKVWADYFPDPGTISKASVGSRYANNFYIYSLEWTKDKLVWKINGEVMFRQTSNVPQVPMYVLLAGGLDKPINGMTTMEVDWVKVYQFK
jgi:beta-glucanase (GH16 family)